MFGKGHTTNVKHGHSYKNRRSPTYKSWEMMRDRVKYPQRSARRASVYANITMDPRWEVFADFLADMGERPPGTSLDRIDSAKGYCRDNCRWATRAVQGQNRKTVKLTLEIAEEMRAKSHAGATAGQLAKEYGVGRSTVFSVLWGRTWRRK